MNKIMMGLLMLVSSVVYAQELWHGRIDDVSPQAGKLLVGDLPFDMSSTTTIASQKGITFSRYDLKVGQNVKVHYDYRDGKNLVTVITIFPDDHEFIEEDD